LSLGTGGSGAVSSKIEVRIGGGAAVLAGTMLSVSVGGASIRSLSSGRGSGLSVRLPHSWHLRSLGGALGPARVLGEWREGKQVLRERQRHSIREGGGNGKMSLPPIC
jgi:hypothetical protein